MKDLREKAGLSQLELSRKCGMLSVATVREIEDGSKSPEYCMIKQIAVALDVTDLDVIYATGSRMRIMREDACLSQIELSEMSNVSRSMISAIEIGRKSPSREVIRALAIPLGVEPKDVYKAVMYDRGLPTTVSNPW